MLIQGRRFLRLVRGLEWKYEEWLRALGLFLLEESEGRRLSRVCGSS